MTMEEARSELSKHPRAWAVIDPNRRLRNMDGDTVDELICWDWDDAVHFQEHADELRDEGDPEVTIEPLVSVAEAHRIYTAACEERVAELTRESERYRELACRQADAIEDLKGMADAVERLREIGRATGCDHVDDPDGRRQLVNCVEQVIDAVVQERNELKARIAELEAGREGDGEAIDEGWLLASGFQWDTRDAFYFVRHHRLFVCLRLSGQWWMEFDSTLGGRVGTYNKLRTCSDVRVMRLTTPLSDGERDVIQTARDASYKIVTHDYDEICRAVWGDSDSHLQSDTVNRITTLTASLAAAERWERVLKDIAAQASSKVFSAIAQAALAGKEQGT